MLDKRSFYSKILLFGEYAVIRQSMALAMPYSLFDGVLKFSNDTGKIDGELKAFAQYLINLQKSGELLCNIDATSFDFDVSQGLYFDSTIPQGYGVGSSGAVCAAVFDRYCQDSKDDFDVQRLKLIMSQLESHFHGSSSGIDPLISYLDKPLLTGPNSKFDFVTLPEQVAGGKGAIFLLNTGRARRTEPLVNLFLEKCNTENFATLCDNVLLPINNSCISSFLEGDFLSLYEFFRELSDFQFRHFNPMIPKLFTKLWEDGLKYEHYYLKLCGAGGGGFILGMTRDFEEAKQLLSNHQVRALFRF